MALQNPSNPKNKFDYTGDIHNQIISVYVEKFGREKKSTDEICRIIQEIALKNENLQKLPDAKENSKVDCDIIKQGIDDFSNQFRNIVDSLNITEKAKAKLQELIDYNFDVAFKTENTNYNEYYKHIIDYESDILKNESAYDKKDIKILLSASSTARYSAYFWKREIDETNTSSPIAKRKWWQWAIIGVADVVGVVDGGIATGAGASTTAYTITNPKNK